LLFCFQVNSVESEYEGENNEGISMNTVVMFARPDEDTRLAHPKIAKIVIEPGGYNAVRTQMDLPIAQKVMSAVRSVRSPVVSQPTSGGSVSLDMIEDILKVPTISVPIVNYDNNQHSKNENLKLQNLWNGIEIHAALLTMD